MHRKAKLRERSLHGRHRDAILQPAIERVAHEVGGKLQVLLDHLARLRRPRLDVDDRSRAQLDPRGHAAGADQRPPRADRSRAPNGRRAVLPQFSAAPGWLGLACRLMDSYRPRPSLAYSPFAMLARQLQRLLPAPRRFHDIARTQELLSGHPGLSRCVVYKEIDAAEAEVDVMALPKKKRGEFVPPTADELRAFAREGGFTGVINSVKFMTTAPRSHFPQTSSQLADLLMRHIFDQADADADGRVTHAEVTRFVGGHGVAPADEALRSLLLELPPLLTLEEFARVLLETRLLTVPRVGESRGECSRPSVHVVASMVPIASAAKQPATPPAGPQLLSLPQSQS